MIGAVHYNIEAAALFCRTRAIPESRRRYTKDLWSGLLR